MERNSDIDEDIPEYDDFSPEYNEDDIAAMHEAAFPPFHGDSERQNAALARYRPENTDVHGTVIVTTQKVDGKTVILNQIIRNIGYNSDYWANQPDGEYEIYINQGGVRNREIPKNEKTRFIGFITPYLKDSNTFVGIVRFSNRKGIATQIQIEPKINWN